MEKLIQQYKAIETYAHISLDDIMNKFTQEVAELIEAASQNNAEETKKEASDALVNILSASQELWIIEETYYPKPTSLIELAINSGKWNADVNAYRNRYSKTPKTLEAVRVSTKDLIENILSFTDSKMSIEEILQESIKKFESRKELYKPQIALRDYISGYKDFPKPGIHFRDVSPLLQHPEALRYAIFEIANACKNADVIVGMDARGFIFGSLVAELLQKPFVMIRKAGKLPWEKEKISYGLEYGKDTIEIQKNSIQPGQKIALIDDLLASGGTIQAGIDLVEKLGWVIEMLGFMISLDDEFLKNGELRQKLEKYPMTALAKYED